MKFNQRRYGSSTCALSFLAASCAAILGIFPTESLYADTTITTSQTQNGGVLAVSPPTLLVTDPSNNPLLTLTNGATTSVINAVIIGNLNGEKGELEINGGSLLQTSGTGTSIGTYGDINISSRSSYLGLNTGSTGMAKVVGSNSRWINSGNYYVGYSGTGVLSIQDGGMLSSIGGLIGYKSGSSGMSTVSGSNSKWTLSGGLGVGGSNGSGDGTLVILDGGSVSNTSAGIGRVTGSVGTATISGANSRWTNSDVLYIGDSGSGTLSIQDGGRVSNTDGYIADRAGSNGSVTVSGVNSTWQNSRAISVGNGGIGTLSILNGGNVIANNAGSDTITIGGQSYGTGTLTVSGENSKLTHNLGINVGVRGMGTMLIQNGGSVSSGGDSLTNSGIGRYAGSNGSVTVSGANSNWTNRSTLFIGNGGAGTLLIQDGGSLSITNNTTGSNVSIGLLSGSNGLATVDGTNSTLTNVGSIYLGVEGTGTLSIQNGGKVSNTNGNIGFLSGSIGSATVTGADSTWINSQSLYIGGSSSGNGGTGSLTISNSGKVIVTGTTKVWSSDTLNFDDGTLETGTLESTNSTGKIVLSGNSNQIRIGSNSTFVGGIQGTGGFIKTGPGTLTLNNANTYAGKTTVEQGTLNVQTALLNNGPASVSITATDDTLSDNPILTRRRNTNASYAGFGATVAGGLNSTAELLAGTNLTGTDNSVNLQVRQRTAVEAGNQLVSDVLNLTGMVNNTAVNLHQTDLFVLRMSYSEALLGGNEPALAAAKDLFLVTLDANNQWVNAVSANIGGTPSYVGDTAWNSSYMTLGQFGVDTNSNTVWAVVNHNSQFAVTVPEPSTLVLGVLASMGLVWRSLRRQRFP